MRDLFNRLATRLRELFGKMERGRLVRLIVLFVLIVGVVVGSVLYLGQTKYGTLYSGMDAAEAGEVYNLLREQGVDVQISGGTIQVPATRVDELLLNFAAQGYPKSGLSYGILQQALAFGTTEAEKREFDNLQRMENVRRTLKRMEKVSDATVMISPAKRASFVIDDSASPATAAVVLTLKPGVDTLTRAEAKVVANLVASSVADLLPENVEITDTNMNQYTMDDQSPSENASEYEKLRADTQNRLEQQVIALLTPVFGEGKVNAMVNVTLDFDSAVTESVEFSPPVEGSEEGIDVSIKELAESVSGVSGVGGVDGQDPNGTAPGYVDTRGNGTGNYTRTSREANRELNSVKTQLTRAAGRISDLSIAILLDSADENVQDDHSAAVTELVATALGISDDYVTVRRMPFLPIVPTPEPEAPIFFDDTSNMRMIITAASVIIVAFLVLMMLRTLFKRRAPANAPQLDGPPGQLVDVLSEDGMPDGMTADGFDHIGGEGKSANRESIEDFITRDAESAAQLLRNWLSDV